MAVFETDRAGEDPLVETVRQQPAAALHFIRAMMFFGGLGSLVVCTVCWTFLYFNWTRCCACQRPLRWWLCTYALVQQLQLPIRLVMLRRLCCSQEADAARLTSSPLWRCSKNLSLLTYGWFVLGIIWVVNSSSASCTGAYRLTVAIIFQAFLRVVLGLIFRPKGQAPESPKIQGASPEEIRALAVEAFSSKTMPADQATCAVCLSDYTEGELLRRLPCGHKFHVRCADEWLRRSSRCPLCVQSICDF